MFEASSTGRLLDEVRAFDFGAENVIDRGGSRVDAIRELDRAIRAAQAEQTAQVAALLDERTSLMVGVGDPCLSVIGELSMARTIGPSAAATQLELAMGMTRLPRVFALFAGGVISEATARVVARETRCLDVADDVLADAEIADKIVGMTTVQAGRAAARVVISIDAEEL